MMRSKTAGVPSCKGIGSVQDKKDPPDRLKTDATTACAEATVAYTYSVDDFIAYAVQQ